MLQAIENKINIKIPLSREEAVWLYLHADNESLSSLASMVKHHHHAPHTASYLIMAIINYTNVCIAGCDYCAFYRLPHQEGAYIRSFDEICKKIETLRAAGGTLAGFNGGFHPKLKIEDYAELFQKLNTRFPDMCFYEMTVAEFMFTCKLSKVSYEVGAQILKDAGTQWITGGGAEILDNGFRKRHSPGKYTVEDYYTAQAAILNAGLNSTATMVIGFDETIEERFNHLESLRKFQENTKNKLTSFLCWTYKPYNNRLGGKEISLDEYLRWLAVCRIYLDNIVHIRTSVLTQNENALIGLRYGANDFDLPLEDEVTQKAGAQISQDFTNILNTARTLGFEPIKRPPFSLNHEHLRISKSTQTLERATA
jgi:cyclic dehypoxanthinyl futalosine synthase